MHPQARLKTITLFLSLFLIIPASSLLSGEGKEAPGKIRVKKGAQTITVKGSTRSWNSSDKTPLHLRSKPRPGQPILNFNRGLPLVKGDRDTDPVVQTRFSGSQALTRHPLAVEVEKNFDGMNYEANGAGWPPDTTGDVGETYYVQGVNTSLGIFRKNDGELVSATTFNDFFQGAAVSGTPCDENNNGDPIVLYDQYAERWFVLNFAWDPAENDGSYFSIAVSKTNDPTGDWWQYALRADNALMDDYPKCGIWHDGIYITANMFQFSGGFQHVKVWALNKSDLYKGTLTAQVITENAPQAFALLPSHAKGANPPPSSAPNYMYCMDADEYGDGHEDSLYVWKYDVDWNDAGNTTWSGPQAMPTAAFNLNSSRVPQQGTSNQVDSLYGRLMNPATYRNFGVYEAVYFCHLVEYNNRRTTRWYEMRISGGTSSIHQQGTYAPDNHHRWMGSVAADKNGNIAMGYSVSSSALYPSVRVAARSASEPLGQLPQGETTLAAGGGSQTSSTRWGDYSSMTIDPTDDETFWYTQQYYSSSGANWHTRIGSFTVGNPPPPTVLNEAMDDLSLLVSTSGDAPWTLDSSTYYYGGDSAQSGAITHSQSTSMETVVNFSSSRAVKFWWKVSSEKNFDYLYFYIDGEEQAKISGDLDWEQKVLNLDKGSHTLRWSYSKDGSVGGGADHGWIDRIQFAEVSGGGALADAVDNPGLAFFTSGSGAWDVDTNVFYHDNDAIESPAISHDENADVETTVSGPAALKFYWKVSSENNYDYLKVYIDGEEQSRISGEADWQQKVFTIGSGSHKVTWSYAKDSSVSRGSDRGWVDLVEVIAGTADPLAEAVDRPGMTFTTSGDVDWDVDRAVYVYGNSAMRSPVLTHDEEGSAETTVMGPATLSFYWKVSSEEGYDFLRFSIDGTESGVISGDVDWVEKTFTLGGGAHTLTWTYEKDYSVSKGSDSGWIDRLQLQR